MELDKVVLKDKNKIKFCFFVILCLYTSGCAKKVMISWDKIKSNSVEAVREEVEYCDADVNAKDREGRTALMCAAWNNSIEVAKYLLEKGAEINAKSKYGGTALLWARDKGYKKMMGFLIKHGAR